MFRIVAVYGLVLACTAFILEWLQYRYAIRRLDPELYGVGVALIFAALGIWVGLRLTGRRRTQGFHPNEKALNSLGISPREREVLGLLAQGHSNKEIARLLDISPNTVKTHVTSVLGKLDASRRTQAIRNARALEILP